MFGPFEIRLRSSLPELRLRMTVRERAMFNSERLLNISVASSDSILQYLGYIDNVTEHDILGRWPVGRQVQCQYTKLTAANCQLQVIFASVCTQSAPLSNTTPTDPSAMWRLQVVAGSQTITGYHDRTSFASKGYDVHISPGVSSIHLCTLDQARRMLCTLDLNAFKQATKVPKIVSF